MKRPMKLFRYVRTLLDPVFREDTAAPECYRADCPSAGHCAVVAIYVKRVFWGEFVSATVDGQSHWFNRIGKFDFDLTGDQFGRPSVQIAPHGELYPGTRVRSSLELNEETKARAEVFIRRLGELHGE